ncbi:MAG: hypothetical protein MAG794_00951 [Gammaproteobacteria bacterium]|nr:hypothetical protein [Gammaproteobacteria bacterium]
MFNLKKTVELLKGGILEPGETWESYRSENHDWKGTACLITIPAIAVSTILAGILSMTFPSYGMVGFGAGVGIGGILLSMIMSLAGVAVASFVISYLAGVFKGKHDFNKGLAALSLAAIPAWLGGALSPLPLIGWIISLAAAVTTLVFLYKIIPVYLEVPEDKRVIHYIISVVVTFIISMILGAILVAGTVSSMHTAALSTSAVTGKIEVRNFARDGNPSLQHRISFADSIMYASARQAGVPLVTSDDHFHGLNEVIFIPKPETG